jgi:hypothetical protein
LAEPGVFLAEQGLKAGEFEGEGFKARAVIGTERFRGELVGSKAGSGCVEGALEIEENFQFG